MKMASEGVPFTNDKLKINGQQEELYLKFLKFKNQKQSDINNN